MVKRTCQAKNPSTREQTFLWKVTEVVRHILLWDFHTMIFNRYSHHFSLGIAQCATRKMDLLLRVSSLCNFMHLLIFSLWTNSSFVPMIIVSESKQQYINRLCWWRPLSAKLTSFFEQNQGFFHPLAFIVNYEKMPMQHTHSLDPFPIRYQKKFPCMIDGWSKLSANHGNSWFERIFWYAQD